MALVSLIDDHRLFSASLAVALKAEGFDVYEPELSSMDAVRHTVLARRPQVVMVDRDLGTVGNGEELLAPFARAGCSVIVVSGTLDDVVVGRCLAAGAVACLHKTEPFPVLLSAIGSVARGDALVPPSERYRLIDAWRSWQACADAAAGAFARLTPREASVLRNLMEGLPVKAIANQCAVSEATVRTQVRGILTKLDVTSQLEAVVLALRTGWQPTAPVPAGTSRPPRVDHWERDRPLLHLGLGATGPTRRLGAPPNA